MRRFSLLHVGTALSLLLITATAHGQSNQLPNPHFRGTNGSVTDFNATVTGDVPTLWRAFAVEGGDLTSEIVPLAADELFPGSPATNAVRITVNAFGTAPGADQGFDSFAVRFSLVDGLTYAADVYLRTDNADNSDQRVLVGVPVFESDGTFTGRGPGSYEAVAATSWTRFEGPDFVETGNTVAEMSFRLIDDLGDNSVLIALPEVLGPELSNLVPNPELSGAGGAVQGTVNGAVPDLWRGFAINGGDITLASVPVAAGELYPGSPATNAVQLTVNTFANGSQGLDHETTLFPILPQGRSLWGEIYLRSANADSSPQPFTVNLNTFDAVAFIDGRFIMDTATTDWGYFGSASVAAPAATTGDVAIRLTETGPENSLLIALPTVSGIPDAMFDDSFEGDPIPPPG